MKTTLGLYKYIEGNPVKKLIFPSIDEQAKLSEYKYSATRMGSAPSITATLKWPSCLDDEWSTKVFVEYNGERYFVKSTPTSSYDNTNRMYSYNIEFVAERAILDSVYFLDIIASNEVESSSSEGEQEEQTQLDSMPDKSEFSFSGDINQFVKRLNDSMVKTGVGGEGGFKAYVDEGIVSDTKLFSASNQYVTDALKSAYELYGVPYYFKGREIHFGNYERSIKRVKLSYGESLLSVTRTSLNKNIITKATGYGSERNIKYYYPNITPKGELKLGGKSLDKYEISNQLRFSNSIKIDEHITRRQTEANDENGAVFQMGHIGLKEESYWYTAMLEPDVTYTLTFRGYYNNTDRSNYVPIILKENSIASPPLAWSNFFIDGHIAYRYKGRSETFQIKSEHYDLYYLLGFDTPLIITSDYEFVVKFKTDRKMRAYFMPYRYSFTNNYYIDEIDLSITSFSPTNNLEIKTNDEKAGNIYCKINLQCVDGTNMDENDMPRFFRGDVFKDGALVSTAQEIGAGQIYIGSLGPGVYEIISQFHAYKGEANTLFKIQYEPVEHIAWYRDYLDEEVELSDIGIALLSGKTEEVGDILVQEIANRMPVSDKLMPAEYRRTLGSNRWYKATNDEGRGEWYGNVIFDNVYDKFHPSEYIYVNEEIYPTIKGVLNDGGKRIDTFLEIAFDKNDNNDVYPEDHEKAGEYIHPYFFAKLKKTDGENSFNLFSQSIESGEMKVSFTTGHVAGCEFTIGVDETSGKNTVLVYEKYGLDQNGNMRYPGDLVRNKDGDVLCGRWGQEKYGTQDIQQDTRNAEVWIALKKDISTMGVPMPDYTAGLVPKSDYDNSGFGDTFVLLNIDLPDAYVIAAEERLEEEIIKYLLDNNSDKYSFSLKLSSIYMADNPNFAEELNENCMVVVKYDDKIYEMFVNSYSLSMSDSGALPEVTITVSKEIKVAKTKVKIADDFIHTTTDQIESLNKNTASIIKKQDANTASIKTTTERISRVEDNISDIDSHLTDVEKQTGVYVITWSNND